MRPNDAAPICITMKEDLPLLSALNQYAALPYVITPEGVLTMTFTIETTNPDTHKTHSVYYDRIHQGNGEFIWARAVSNDGVQVKLLHPLELAPSWAHERIQQRVQKIEDWLQIERHRRETGLPPRTMRKRNFREVFESDTFAGKYGILCDGAIEYEPDFDNYSEAKAIADAHDQGALTYEEAIGEMTACARTQFDPELLSAFLDCLDQQSNKSKPSRDLKR